MTTNSWMTAGFTLLVKDEDLPEFLADCKAEIGIHEEKGFSQSEIPAGS